MKILIVNNHTEHLDSLHKALKGHQLEVQKYRSGLNFHSAGKDLVILSGGGGQGLEIHDLYTKGKLWYDDEMRFVRDCTLPIIGICMGFEVICRLHGSEVRELPELIQGFTEADTTATGQRSLSHKRLKQFESHRWAVPAVNTDQFEILAKSVSGVEMIRHKSRPLLATQFHPEVGGGTLSLSGLIQSFATTPTY